MKKHHEISTEELKSFLGAIKIRFGIDFTSYELKSLKRGFGRVLVKNNFNSLFDLWKVLLQNREFIKTCIDELTVNMTEMFRNPEIWPALLGKVKSSFLTQEELKIWHAGCSSGEEVYSMAFVTHLLNFTYKTKVLATDINSKVLAIAEKGDYSSINNQKYRQRFESAFESENISSFAQCDEEQFIIRNRLKRNITFQKHNLVTDSFPVEQDIIFCRNVLIYFDERLKMATLKKMYNSLREGGFLVVGFYDTMPIESRTLFTSDHIEAKIYRKVG